MASEIRVDKINSLSGVGTVTLSPTGVDIAGITTAATLRATTGIVTSLTAGSLTSLGAVSGTTGTFSGDVDIADKIVHTGDTDTAIRFSGADTITAETGGSERARIDSSGRLQIGASNNSGANTKLVVGAGNNVNTTAIINTGDVDVDALTLSNWDGSTATNKVKIHFDNSGVGGFDIGMPAATDAFVIEDTGAAERMRIDSSGRVMIGTTTVGDANGDDLTVAGSGHSGITIRSGTSSTSQVMFTDSTSGTGSYIGIVAYRHASDSMGLFTNATERLTIDSSGKVGINQSSPQKLLDVYNTSTNESNMYVRNASVNYLVKTMSDQVQVGSETNHPFYAISNNQYVARFDGDGIKFGSDTAAANALDDYEEGDSTPTPNSGGVNSGVTDGKYTKIGNFCIYAGSIELDGTANNSLMMGFSLPFTAAGGRAGSGVIRYSNQSYADTITFHVDAGQAQVSFYQFGGSTYSYLEAGTSRYDFCITYMTA